MFCSEMNDFPSLMWRFKLNNTNKLLTKSKKNTEEKVIIVPADKKIVKTSISKKGGNLPVKDEISDVVKTSAIKSINNKEIKTINYCDVIITNK